ncbi:competence protein CoiA family protein [Candidatus Marifrigoribacter sp. Uisw_064]|jgi:competence protein CoiA|uniref:competence protein CoiA family protein n=1 Tax=Candidatus Marifrigoribacter sp. Uisw_064 TaxID=3230970 RepID=UPI003D383F81
MIWALVENKKIKATPKTRGRCLLCGEEVISKCGDLNVWHWAHMNIENCDSWYEPETFWHVHWKMTFGKENVEIGIKIGKKRHIADVLTKKQVVIELQNSQIKKQTIKEREEFYGERMLWLINGGKFKKNLIIQKYWNDKRYKELENNPEELIKLIMEPKPEKGKNEEFFKWKYPRKSWLNVQRPVFIDLGIDSLFMVTEGMGESQIRGTYIPKEKFIMKYGGNYKYYSQHRL